MIKRYLTFFLLLSAAFAQNVNAPTSNPYPNDPTAPVGVKQIAVLNSAGNMTAATNSNTGAQPFIVTSIETNGSGSTAWVASNGIAQCVFDSNFASGGAVTYVILSTTAAPQCHAQLTAPGANIGLVGTLAGLFTGIGALANVQVEPSIWPSSSGGGGGGSGTVTSLTFSAPLTGGTVTTAGTAGCPTCAIGPGSSTANHIAEFSGTDGITLKDGGAVPSGTVTSITAGSGLAGGTITNSGTISLTLPVASATSATMAGNLSGPANLPNGVTATTQTAGDNTTDLATDAFVLANATPSHVNQVTVSGLVTTYTDTTLGAAIIDALTAQPGNHIFDATGFTGTQTWSVSGNIAGTGAIGHLSLPCGAINLSVALVNGGKLGVYGCNPQGTNINATSGFPSGNNAMFSWGSGGDFASPLSNIQFNGQGNAAIGVNNAGCQENCIVSNVRVQDAPVANFQLSNLDGSINSHVQNVYMTNLNSIYINATCTANTRAFYSNTNGSGVYIDKATFVLGNGAGGSGCQVAPSAATEVNGPIEAHDWHIEGNRLGSSITGVNMIAVGLTNAGNSHNDTFIGTKFATANGGAGFKIYSGVTSFMALNTDGVGSQLTDLIYDVANSNHITLANNPKLLSYMLDNNGNAWMQGGNCSDMTNGFCQGQGTTVWEYIVNNIVVASLSSTGTFTNNGVSWTTTAGVPSANCTVGSINTNSSATSASTVLYVCYPANTWTAVTVP